jgi:hypothetical protein
MVALYIEMIPEKLLNKFSTYAAITNVAAFIVLTYLGHTVSSDVRIIQEDADRRAKANEI